MRSSSRQHGLLTAQHAADGVQSLSGANRTRRQPCLEEAIVEVQSDQAALVVDDAQLPVVRGPPHPVLNIAIGTCDQLACQKVDHQTSHSDITAVAEKGISSLKP